MNFITYGEEKNHYHFEEKYFPKGYEEHNLKPQINNDGMIIS